MHCLLFSNDAEGPIEIIEDHKNGLLVLKPDLLSLEDSIQEMLTDKFLAKKIVKSGLAKVRSH